MIQTKEIEISDKNKVEHLRYKYKHFSASHAFASLYIWKIAMGLSLYLGDEIFAVKSSMYGKNAWFFPCGSDEQIIGFLKQAMLEPDFQLCYMRENDVEFLREHFGNFTIEEKPSDNEYLYSRTEQEMLAGKKFSKQRNHISRVERDCTLRTEHLSSENLDSAAAVINVWEKKFHENSPLGLTDDVAANLLLSSARTLGVFGTMVYVNEVPYAVVAGYPLSNDTFDMCLAKQKDTLSGLAVYAKHEFVTSLPECYSCINAEEDLGIEGLKIMKNQMHPISQTKMFCGKI